MELMSKGPSPRVLQQIGVVKADGCTCVKVAYRSAFLSVSSYSVIIPSPSCGLDDRSPGTGIQLAACVGVRGWSMFTASMETILLSGFAEPSRHPVESASVMG